MEGPLAPDMGPSLADVLLCTFENKAGHKDVNSLTVTVDS
jgi:hypothetical protein